MFPRILFVMTLILSGCAQHDDEYYRLHPRVLEKKLMVCFNQQPNTQECQKLKNIAIELNGLSYDLRRSPQGFGLKILQLQQAKARAQTDDEKNHLEAQIKQYLAVVDWLESPKS